jgi:hypothetical protein
MIVNVKLSSLAILWLSVGPSAVSNAAAADRLFEDNSVIEVRLTAPYKQIMRERSDEE